jgi:hypothetical protein
MNNTSALSTHNTRGKPGSVQDLIETGLGYCCEYVFWRAYKHLPTDLIAARLGMAPRTINRHRQHFDEDLIHCAKCSNCMKDKIK